MTKPEMQDLINQLYQQLLHTAVQCHYCRAVFAATDPAQSAHWRECPNHPARLELAELRSQLKWTALELDKCRSEARLYHNAVAVMQGMTECEEIRND